MSRAINGHNAEARRAATTRKRQVAPAAAELATAAAPEHGHVWKPVRGPHLRVTRTKHARNRTGCVGISLSRSANGHTYYVANLGSTNRKFRVETLGKTVAFRRALEARAEHERAVSAANQLIQQARNQSTAP